MGFIIIKTFTITYEVLLTPDCSPAHAQITVPNSTILQFPSKRDLTMCSFPINVKPAWQIFLLLLSRLLLRLQGHLHRRIHQQGKL